MKIYLTILIMILSVTACDSFFSRSDPGENSIKNEFFPDLQKIKEYKFDYLYNGTVGGTFVVGRIECGQEQLKILLKDSKIRREIPNDYSMLVQSRLEMLLKDGINKPLWLPSDYNGVWLEYRKEKHLNNGLDYTWEYYFRKNDQALFFLVSKD